MSAEEKKCQRMLLILRWAGVGGGGGGGGVALDYGAAELNDGRMDGAFIPRSTSELTCGALRRRAE